MKNTILFVMLLLTGIGAAAQVRISELPSFSGNAEDALVPVAIGGITYRVPGKTLANGKVDSVTISTASGNNSDTLYQWKNGIKSIKGLIPKGGIANVNVKDSVLTATSSFTIGSLQFGDRGSTFINGNAVGGSFTITLPPASDMAGKEVTIQKSDASGNYVIVKGNGSQNINGQARDTLFLQYEARTYKSNGVQPYIVARTNTGGTIVNTSGTGKAPPAIRFD